LGIEEQYLGFNSIFVVQLFGEKYGWTCPIIAYLVIDQPTKDLRILQDEGCSASGDGIVWCILWQRILFRRAKTHWLVVTRA
jgi:hypothetical protein